VGRLRHYRLLTQPRRERAHRVERAGSEQRRIESGRFRRQAQLQSRTGCQVQGRIDLERESGGAQ
jgi:hypothetical protein